jgi:hypothetical protein
MHLTTYPQTILKSFALMDIENLRINLNEEFSYENTTKEIFLFKIENVFEAYKNSGDTELIIYDGECNDRNCPNLGKKGYRFVGNHSKNYIDLIFETKKDNITDIYQCSTFKTYINMGELGEKADIYIFLDEQNSFVKTPEYCEKVISAKAAFLEIVKDPPRQLDFEALNSWLDKHMNTYKSIGEYDPFDSPMRWTPFASLYNDLKDIRDFIYYNIAEISKANSETMFNKTEQDIINWIINYEVVGINIPFILKRFVKKVGDHFRWDIGNPIYFKDDVFVGTMYFIEYFLKQQHDMLYKYTTYTNEEAFTLSNQYDTFSLKFHLDYRKAKEEAGIHIPFYMNKQNDSFFWL